MSRRGIPRIPRDEWQPSYGGQAMPPAGKSRRDSSREAQNDRFLQFVKQYSKTFLGLHHLDAIALGSRPLIF